MENDKEKTGPEENRPEEVNEETGFEHLSGEELVATLRARIDAASPDALRRTLRALVAPTATEIMFQPLDDVLSSILEIAHELDDENQNQLLFCAEELMIEQRQSGEVG